MVSETYDCHNISRNQENAGNVRKEEKTMASGLIPKKPSRHGKVPCGVCQGAITNGKGKALLCKGQCSLWFHRGCVSVPLSLYKTLSNSEDPFVCLCCTNTIFKREITALKNELQNMAEVPKMHHRSIEPAASHRES